MFFTNSPEFSPSLLMGFFDASSAAVQHSEFLSGFEGASKSLNHAVWLKRAKQSEINFQLLKQLKLDFFVNNTPTVAQGLSSCSVSTTATNSHKYHGPSFLADPA